MTKAWCNGLPTFEGTVMHPRAQCIPNASLLNAWDRVFPRKRHPLLFRLKTAMSHFWTFPWNTTSLRNFSFCGPSPEGSFSQKGAPRRRRLRKPDERCKSDRACVCQGGGARFFFWSLPLGSLVFSSLCFLFLLFLLGAFWCSGFVGLIWYPLHNLSNAFKGLDFWTYSFFGVFQTPISLAKNSCTSESLHVGAKQHCVVAREALSPKRMSQFGLRCWN